MKSFICILVIIAMFGISIAQTIESNALITREAQKFNFYQETDITFFQTFPFIVFWGQILDQNLYPGQQTHWDVILGSATIISLANAMWYAKEKVDNEARQHSN